MATQRPSQQAKADARKARETFVAGAQAALALTIGICFGIYSSVFVAAAIAMWLGIKRDDLVKGQTRRETDPNDPNAGATV